jgi:hypothetical protein
VDGQGHEATGKDDPGTEQRHGEPPLRVDGQGHGGTGKDGPGTEQRHGELPP